MDVKTYVERRKAELEQFQRNWLANQGADGWPEELEEGEWFEQEAAFGSYLERAC